MGKLAHIPRNKWFIGADKEIQWTVKDTAGVAVDITGWTFKWVVRKDNKKGAASVLSLTPSIVVAASGTVKAVIADTDTDALQPGVYYYTLWRTNAGFEVELAFGDAPLEMPASV